MNPDVQIVLSYYAHYIMLPGYDRTSALAAAFGRVPSIPPRSRGGIAASVVRAAQRGEAIARAIEAIGEADPASPLSGALSGQVPPMPTVAVRVILTTADGRVGSAVVNVPWDMPIGEVISLAREHVIGESGDPGQWQEADWSIRGPTLVSSPQSQ